MSNDALIGPRMDEPRRAWTVHWIGWLAAEFVAALGCIAVVSLILPTPNDAEMESGAPVVLLACLLYSIRRLKAPTAGANRWGWRRHYFFAFGAFLIATLLVSWVTPGNLHVGGVGLIAFLVLSGAHAQFASAPSPRITRNTGIAYSIAAVFVLPYLFLAPGRTRVEEDLNRLRETLREQYRTAPSRVEDLHRQQFISQANTMEGWPEYIAETQGFHATMTQGVPGKGFGGTNDSLQANFWFAPRAPSGIPGRRTSGELPCIKVDLNLVIAGNTYLPGELRAVITTHGMPHDDLMVEHLRTLLAEFDAVIEEQ